jgi:hypothetical protein
MKKNQGVIWIILLFFITLWRYWHLVTPNKEVREYILRDFIQDGQMIAFLSALEKGQLLLWDVTRGGGNLINNGMGLFYPLNLLYLPFVRNDYIVHHVFQYMFVLHIFLMGAFAYLLLRELQASRPASFIAGLIYSFNGYTLVHSMHLGLITTMTWLPLIFFFLERGRRQRRLMPIVWGGLVLGIGILASHPQVYYYMALSVCFYVVFWTIAGWSKAASWKERMRPLGNLILLGVVAFGVSAIQIVPSFSLGVTSVHAAADKDFKWLNPLKFYQLAMFVIPWSLSAVRDWNILVSERYAYMGWVTLIFGLAILIWRKEAKIYAYAMIAAISLFLAMGEDSFLFKFFYDYIPGYGMFRYPSRVLVLFVFGMTVLAGFGLDYYLSESASSYIRRRLSQVLKILATGGLVVWVISIGSLTATVKTEVHELLIHFVSQLTLTLIIIWLWWGIVTIGKSRPIRSGFIVGLVAVVLFDLWSQGTVGDRVPSPDKLKPEEESVVAFLNEKRKEGEVFRIENNLLRESLLTRNEISSYITGDRLMNRDYLDLMWAVDENPRIMDLLNVQYIVGKISKDQQPNQTLRRNLNLGPNSGGKTLEFHNRPIRTDRIEIFSHLSFGDHIPQGEKVAEITLWDKKGQSFKFPIRAGIETAEWAIERPGLKVMHRPVEIARSWPVENEGYQGHLYRASKILSRSIEVVKVELRFARIDGALNIQNLLIGRKDIAVLEENRFETVTPSILRNRYALPRAFLVPEARVITDPEKMREAIGWFDPEKIVLLSRQPSLQDQSKLEVNTGKYLQGNGSIRILSYSPRRILIEADTVDTQYLVLSDTYHPWWRAKIDGKRTEVLKANLALRAVVVPQGRHEIEFYLVPVSFYWGAGITFTTIVGGCITGYLLRRRQE